MEDSRFPSAQQREAARKAANNLFVDQEKDAAKHEFDGESAASDAKTARLRALRLEKEQAERDAASAMALPPKPG